MPQVQKPEIDARIRAAALQRFAADGYPATTMAAIADTAQVATANIYRYYPDGKRQLFDAVLPGEIADRLVQLVDRRVDALLEPLDEGGGDAPAHQLLDHWVAHRLEVAILLGRDRGTPHEGFGQRFVDQLVALSEEGLRAAGADLTEVHRRLLRIVFDNTRRALVEILLAFDDEPSIRRAIATFWSYQLPGLDGLRRTILAGPGG